MRRIVFALGNHRTAAIQPAAAHALNDTARAIIRGLLQHRLHLMTVAALYFTTDPYPDSDRYWRSLSMVLGANDINASFV